MKRFRLYLTSRVKALLIVGISFLAVISCSKKQQQAERVILIGIDGMGISGFQEAVTPNLDQLVREGALSFKTRAVMPTVSAPNWGSHLLGAGPEQHGITANGWTKDNYTLEPAVTDSEGYFPSIFKLIKDQKPGYETALFYDWKALADMYNPGFIDTLVFSETYDATLRKAIPWVIDKDPEFTFIYVGHPDEVGHEYKWGSNEYLQALNDVDAAIGKLLSSLKSAGKYYDTHFIIVTDHGGVEFGHGGLSLEEIEVPWIIAGPGIIKDKLIEQPNNVFNTASTIAYLFGLDQPDVWIGKPVMGAFKNSGYEKTNVSSYVPQPFSSHNSGMYIESDAVSFRVSDPEVKIRYTVNGNDPDPRSPLYERPILIMKSTRLKAAGFIEDQRSRVTTVDYVKVEPVAKISLENPPEAQYSANGPFSLVDRIRASNEYDDGKWIGFSGSDLICTLELNEIKNISRIRIGFLNLSYYWIFPPTEIIVSASVDGKKYKELGRMEKSQIKNKTKTGKFDLTVPLSPAKARFIKIVAKNTGVCPPGHKAEGSPAWLFTDEIMIE